MVTIKELVESEICDFFAPFGTPGEPETPGEMQQMLLARVSPILAEAEKRIAELQSVNDELKKFPDQIVSYVARLGTSEIGGHTKNVIYRAAQKVKDSAAGISKG